MYCAKALQQYWVCQTVEYSSFTSVVCVNSAVVWQLLWLRQHLNFMVCGSFAPCGLRGCKNRPAPFPGRLSYKATKPGLVLFCNLACLNCIVAYYGPFYVLLIFVGMCFLLVLLVKLSLLAKWLARKTPLRKPNRGEIISIKTRPKRVYDYVGLLYNFVVVLHDVYVVSSPMWYIFYFYGTI